MIRLPNSCPLKYPSWFKINLKFLLEVKIHLSIYLRTKNWTFIIAGCTSTDWFKLVNSIEKKLRKPYQWIELIQLIYHREIYINSFSSFYGFQSIFSIELTNLNQSVLVQPAIIKVQFSSADRWKGEFLPPTKTSSLSWTSSDILRDNSLIVWSSYMNFLTQWSVLSKMTQPIMHSISNAILLVWNKKNVHKSETILQNHIGLALNRSVRKSKSEGSVVIV